MSKKASVKIDARALVESLRREAGSTRWSHDSLDGATANALSAVADAIEEATPALREEREARRAAELDAWRRKRSAR